MRFWALILLAGCRSSNDPHAPVQGATSASASALPAVATTATPTAIPACSIEASVAIAPKDLTSLENVRVVHGGRTLVTWQDANTAPRMGDSSVSANAAWIDWSASPRYAMAKLPYRAYASAEWSHIGPTRGNGLELFTYGIAGKWVFTLYDQNETALGKLDINDDPPKAAKTFMTNMTVREDFAVAENAPVAAVAGWESPCPSYYACDQLYQQGMEKGFVDGVRVIDLASKRSELVWKSSAPRSHKQTVPTYVPAIAIGKTKGAVAFRLDKSIQLAPLDASHEPSPPVQIASAEVGAPAVAIDGDHVIVAWAERAAASDPYHLVVWVDGATHVVKTGTQSAFAPALAAHDGEVLLAWMEGDAAKRGVVRMSRVSLTGNWPDLSAAPALSETTGNARDPEISMQGDEAIVVWSEIAQASRIQVRKLSCPR